MNRNDKQDTDIEGLFITKMGKLQSYSLCWLGTRAKQRGKLPLIEYVASSHWHAPEAEIDIIRYRGSLFDPELSLNILKHIS